MRLTQQRRRRLATAAVAVLFAAPLACTAESPDAATSDATTSEPATSDAPTSDAPTPDASATDAPTPDATTRTGKPPDEDDGNEGDGGPQLPLGGRQLFPAYRLVAYYGTAGTDSLGVLGERPPGATTKRLREVAKRFSGGGAEIQIAYELISTIADGSPGSDGDYSHFLARSLVKDYVRAARRYKAYLVLDLQPGRSTFLSQAKRFRWALRKPWVGLALDPEWRMRPGEVPGQQIGHVTAQEVNRLSAWLSKLTVRNDLPQKLLMLHQFRTDMVLEPHRIAARPRLAMVQHIDGFGTRSQKLETYNTVERAEQFTMGFKLFYDEDIDLFEPRDVLRLRPRISYVSYQ